MRGADAKYAERLEAEPGWKRLLDVQRPYRWNLRRLGLGKTLDIGCGVGRHLAHLPAGSVGVDFNKHAIVRARARGCEAYTPEEFSSRGERFDSLLLSHVLEHLAPGESRALLDQYLPFLTDRGRVVIVCPQEKGYWSPPGDRPEDEEAEGEAHVTFLDAEAIGDLLTAAGLQVERAYSFPFPRPVGKVFRHNETVVIARR